MVTLVPAPPKVVLPFAFRFFTFTVSALTVVAFTVVAVTLSTAI